MDSIRPPVTIAPGRLRSPEANGRDAWARDVRAPFFVVVNAPPEPTAQKAAPSPQMTCLWRFPLAQ